MNIRTHIVILSAFFALLISGEARAYYSAASVSLTPPSSSDDPAAPHDTRRESIPLSECAGKNACAGISDLSILARSEVRNALFLYLTDGREYARRGITRYNRYIHDIENIFTQNPDIPREIIYLPLLESGYSPFAVSRMKAVGVWQIIAPTARELGLAITPLVDERQDPKKSTAAAIHHLRNLMNGLQSWDLALAAYNCGTRRVVRGMVRTKSNDFWVLASSKMLRTETMNYIPHFAALALIASRSDLFHLEGDLPEENPVESYTLKYPVRIDDLAKMLR
ncbi:MAG TPA: lytic transglycosylase domain-containing protein, partial [Spirochaetota bacterium]